MKNNMRVMHDGSTIKDRTNDSLIKELCYLQENINKFKKVKDWQKHDFMRAAVGRLNYDKKQIIGELYEK